MQSDYAFNYPMQADTLLPLKGSVTSALKYQPEKDDFVPQVLVSEDKTDKEKGTIAHKILEHFDFCSDGDVYIQTQKMLDSDILTEQELSKVNLDRLNQALTSGAFDHIGKKTLLRERGFLVNIEANKILDTTSVEPVLLQGVIDLLVVDGDSAEIIDYKYSALKSSALKEKDKKQLDLYAYAVEKALKKKVDKKTLVNVYSGETVEID
jgi:ATP-dependent helicase/nuclease subunit A